MEFCIFTTLLQKYFSPPHTHIYIHTSTVEIKLYVKVVVLKILKILFCIKKITLEKLENFKTFKFNILCKERVFIIIYKSICFYVSRFNIAKEPPPPTKKKNKIIQKRGYSKNQSTMHRFLKNLQLYYKLNIIIIYNNSWFLKIFFFSFLF